MGKVIDPGEGNETIMMRIGKTYIERKKDKARLCADIVISGRKAVLWFAVALSQEDYLCIGSADPFVTAFLPCAMRGNHEIICEDSISERLYYQLNSYLIPTLSFAGGIYHPIRISAPLTAKRRECAGAVGTGFSGGVDSLYTIMCHNRECEYPLTHIAVFNSGVFEGKESQKSFEESCRRAEQFAREQNLKTVFVDTNLQEILPERFLDVYSFRNLACAQALQGLFSVYLLSSGHDAASFSLDLRNSASYDLLTVNCISTETISFYLSGAEVKRSEKLQALAEWELSWKWLHPCIYGFAGDYNCGHCKKCARDQTTLYAMGMLDRYGAVFDVKEYRKYLPQRLAFVLANRGNHLYDETLELLKDQKKDIPQAAYIYEKQFRKSMQNLSIKKTDREEQEHEIT